MWIFLLHDLECIPKKQTSLLRQAIWCLRSKEVCVDTRMHFYQYK